MCLVVVIALGVGRALQIATVNAVTRADESELILGKGIADTRGPCPALDEYVNRTMTIDELRDLQDRLCPDLSELQNSAK